MEFSVTAEQRRRNAGLLIVIRPFRWELRFHHTPEVCTIGVTIGPVRLSLSY